MEVASTAMNLVADMAHSRSDHGFCKMVCALLLTRGAALQSVLYSIEPVAKVRAPLLPRRRPLVFPVAPAAGLPSGPELEALIETIRKHSVAATEAVQQDRDSVSLRCFEELASAFQRFGNRVCEVAAFVALSFACVVFGGSRRAAFRAASAAVKVARASEDAALVVAALEGIMSVGFALGDPDEVLRAANEAEILALEIGDKDAEVWAKLAVAKARLATDDPHQAVVVAEQVAEYAQKLHDKDVEISAVTAIFEANVLLGNFTNAAKVAREGMVIGQSNSRAIAAFWLMLGIFGDSDCGTSCLEASNVFREIADRSGEVAAQLVGVLMSSVRGDAQEVERSLAVSYDCLAFFETAGNRSGEAAALVAVATCRVRQGQPVEAEHACEEAARIFRELHERSGESHVSSLIKDAKVLLAKPTPATVTVDDVVGIATVEVTDCSSGNSFRRAVWELQAYKELACLVLHVSGATDPGAAQANGRDFGMFLMGLRTLGLPIIVSAVGRISGPLWALVLTTDYRIAAVSATFVCPLWGKPECLRSFIGHHSAVELCMGMGPKDSLVMLETGVLHQLQKSADDARKAAVEMAKKVARTPSMSCRRQPFVLNQSVEEYAMAAVQRKFVN